MLPALYRAAGATAALRANGKLDRRALPEPQASRLVRRPRAPRDEHEQRLARVWEDLLDGWASVGSTTISSSAGAIRSWPCSSRSTRSSARSDSRCRWPTLVARRPRWPGWKAVLRAGAAGRERAARAGQRCAPSRAPRSCSRARDCRQAVLLLQPSAGPRDSDPDQPFHADSGHRRTAFGRATRSTRSGSSRWPPAIYDALRASSPARSLRHRRAGVTAGWWRSRWRAVRRSRRVGPRRRADRGNARRAPRRAPARRRRRA